MCCSIIFFYTNATIQLRNHVQRVADSIFLFQVTRGPSTIYNQPQRQTSAITHTSYYYYLMHGTPKDRFLFFHGWLLHTTFVRFRVGTTR